MSSALVPVGDNGDGSLSVYDAEKSGWRHPVGGEGLTALDRADIGMIERQQKHHMIKGSISDWQEREYRSDLQRDSFSREYRRMYGPSLHEELAVERAHREAETRRADAAERRVDQLIAMLAARSVA